MARRYRRRRSSSSSSAWRKGFNAGKRKGRVSLARFRRFSRDYAKGYSAGVKARSGGRRRRRSSSRRRRRW